MIIHLKRTHLPSEFLFEIPSSLSLNQIDIGEKFTVFLLQDKQKIPLEACFIADKRSLLVANEVVRMTKFSPHCYIAKIIRPVEPKETQKNKTLGDVKSPMTGKVISIAVKEQEQVKVGDVLLIIEAMKMENRILAEGDGVIKNIKVTSGMNVTAGELLLTLGSL